MADQFGAAMTKAIQAARMPRRIVGKPLTAPSRARSTLGPMMTRLGGLFPKQGPQGGATRRLLGASGALANQFGKLQQVNKLQQAAGAVRRSAGGASRPAISGAMRSLQSLLRRQ